MRLTLNKNDTVKIIVYCWEQDGEVEASHLTSEIPKENINVVEKVEFEFRKPNYEDSNTIIRNANMKMDGGEANIDPAIFQDAILQTLLVGWDMKNEHDEKVPLNVNVLVPSIARAAVSGILKKIRI